MGEKVIVDCPGAYTTYWKTKRDAEKWLKKTKISCSTISDCHDPKNYDYTWPCSGWASVGKTIYHWGMPKRTVWFAEVQCICPAIFYPPTAVGEVVGTGRGVRWTPVPATQMRGVRRGARRR